MNIWKARIQAFVSSCAGWLCRHIGRHAHADTLSTVQPTRDEYAAEREMNRKRICELEGLLAQMQKECCTLKNRLSSQRELVAHFLQKSDDELRKAVAYNCSRSQDGKHWEVVTEYCCLGGCDMGIYPFDRERDALLFAALLSALGHKPSHNTACSDCYAEYGKDCV